MRWSDTHTSRSHRRAGPRGTSPTRLEHRRRVRRRKRRHCKAWCASGVEDSRQVGQGRVVRPGQEGTGAVGLHPRAAGQRRGRGKGRLVAVRGRPGPLRLKGRKAGRFSMRSDGWVGVWIKRRGPQAPSQAHRFRFSDDVSSRCGSEVVRVVARPRVPRRDLPLARPHWAGRARCGRRAAGRGGRC